jgi:hypothetical protein
VECGVCLFPRLGLCELRLGGRVEMCVCPVCVLPRRCPAVSYFNSTVYLRMGNLKLPGGKALCLPRSSRVVAARARRHEPERSCRHVCPPGYDVLCVPVPARRQEQDRLPCRYRQAASHRSRLQLALGIIVHILTQISTHTIHRGTAGCALMGLSTHVKRRVQSNRMCKKRTTVTIHTVIQAVRFTVYTANGCDIVVISPASGRWWRCAQQATDKQQRNIHVLWSSTHSESMHTLWMLDWK